MKPVRFVGRSLALLSLGALGGATILTARHLLTTPQPLDSGLAGEGRIDRQHGGDVYYTVAGPADAPPMVLLHDLYTGASSFEFRSVFTRLATQYRVYAPDWLGFGMSERPALAFTGEFYAMMLAGFLRDVVGRPALLVAHGRAANIAARATSDSPELVERLIMVSPLVAAGVELDPTLAQAIVRTAQRTALGMIPYALFSTRTLLRRLALQRGDGAASEESLDHQYASAHQFGGQHALLTLLTGELDLPVQNELPLIQPLVLLVSGARDNRRPREVMEDLAIHNPYADLEIIPNAGAAVFEDQPVRFVERVISWAGRDVARPSLAAHLLPTASVVSAPAPARASGETAATAVPASRAPGAASASRSAPASVQPQISSQSAPRRSGATPRVSAAPQAAASEDETDTKPRPVARAKSSGATKSAGAPKKPDASSATPRRSTGNAGEKTGDGKRSDSGKPDGKKARGDTTTSPGPA